MQIGVTFPHLEIGSDPAVIRAYVQAVEELGYSHLTAYDHVLGAEHNRDDPRMAEWPEAAYCDRDAFHEPLVLFGYLAAITTRLEFATGVLILPQRQAALVAKQATEVDLLSGGRLRLGVGVGWNHLEYEALGEPWQRRGVRMVEQIALMRALWADPVVDFSGEFHSVPRLGINPRPTRSIPIWMGALTSFGLRRAARYAEGVISARGATHPATAGWVQDAHEALAAVGRDPATFSIEGRIDLYGRQPAAIAADLALWAEFGASHISLNAMAPPHLRHLPLTVDQHIDALRALRELAPFA
jgi:probable F420-dependent oxidoreductase